MFPPGAPKVLYILLTPIEFVSVVILRPITLTIRLFANMVAGHFLLAVFFLGSLALITGFPYLLGAPALTPRLAHALLRWLDESTFWRSTDAAFYTVDGHFVQR